MEMNKLNVSLNGRGQKGEWTRCAEREGFDDHMRAKIADKMNYYRHIDGKTGFIEGVIQMKKSLPRENRESIVGEIKKNLIDRLSEMGGKRTITTVIVKGRKLSLQHHFSMERMPSRDEMKAKVGEMQGWLYEWIEDEGWKD